MRYFITLLLVFIVFSKVAVADSGYIQPCSINPFSMFFSPSTEKIYIGCAGNEFSLELCVINPYTLTIENTFLLDGLIESVYPINNGDSLLVLLSDVDGDINTEDGELRQISSSTGITENYFSFNTIPLALSVDSTETYAYVTSGLDTHEIVPKITKIILDTYEIVLSTAYGFYSMNCALNSDGSKLYVQNQSFYWTSSSEHYYEIGVFDTQTMSPYPFINIDLMPSRLKMGYDNRLYVSHAIPSDNHDVLTIVDTVTDSYTSLQIPDIGFESLAVDSVNGKLYCTSLNYQYVPELDLEMLEPTEIVYEIDLENGYSYRLFTVAPEPVIAIESVPLNNPGYSCRLFAMSENENKIYYFDVPIE